MVQTRDMKKRQRAEEEEEPSDLEEEEEEEKPSDLEILHEHLDKLEYLPQKVARHSAAIRFLQEERLRVSQLGADTCVNMLGICHKTAALDTRVDRLEGVIAEQAAEMRALRMQLNTSVARARVYPRALPVPYHRYQEERETAATNMQRLWRGRHVRKNTVWLYKFTDSFNGRTSEVIPHNSSAATWRMHLPVESLPAVY
jgi:hypothetical protein